MACHIKIYSNSLQEAKKLLFYLSAQFNSYLNHIYDIKRIYGELFQLFLLYLHLLGIVLFMNVEMELRIFFFLAFRTLRSSLLLGKPHPYAIIAIGNEGFYSLELFRSILLQWLIQHRTSLFWLHLDTREAGVMLKVLL